MNSTIYPNGACEVCGAALTIFNFEPDPELEYTDEVKTEYVLCSADPENHGPDESPPKPVFPDGLEPPPEAVS